MKRALLAGALALSPAADAAVTTEVVEYRHDGTVLQGSIAFDKAAKGRRPGVLVVHEWWGHGPYVRRRAEQLARQGYVAFAIDMYGKGVVAKTHEEAGKLAGAVRGDRALMRARAKAALDVFKARPELDPSRIAAIGYCFGGTTALEMARAGMDLKGVASFHGSLDTPRPEETKGVKAKVLVLHGAEDKHVNPQVAAFQDEMRRSGADWQMVFFGGAVHSFTVREAGDDPSKGAAYDPAADRRSWRILTGFLAEVLDR